MNANWQKAKQYLKENLKRVLLPFLGVIGTALCIGLGLQSCTVVRTVTTHAETVNRGDTVVQITTRTVENYTAKDNR